MLRVQVIAMYRLILLISTLAAALIFAGCHFTDFSEEKANEAALSYLLEKYGEEFVAKEGGIRTDSIAFGNNWYELTVVKKSEENEETQRKYTICVTTDRKYTVIRDTVMFDYYNSLYEKYVIPIIEKEMEGIPYVVLVDSKMNLSIKAIRDGVEAESNIPNDLEDENSIFEKRDFVFNIYISETYDKGQLTEICSNINNSLTKDNYYEAYIVLLSDEEFTKLAKSKDKYQENQVNEYFLGKKKYKV
jgi:hypothetical protein